MIISQHTGRPVKVMFAMVGKGKAVHYSPSNDETLCGKAIRAYVSADESADAPLCKVCARIERVKSDEHKEWEAAQVTAATREGVEPMDDICGGTYELCSLASKGKSCDCETRVVTTAEARAIMQRERASVEIQGEYVEAPDAHGHMAEQTAWMTQEGVCVGLCAVGTGCEHCDTQYGPAESQTDTQEESSMEIQMIPAGPVMVPVVPVQMNDKGMPDMGIYGETLEESGVSVGVVSKRSKTAHFIVESTNAFCGKTVEYVNGVSRDAAITSGVNVCGICRTAQRVQWEHYHAARVEMLASMTQEPETAVESVSHTGTRDCVICPTLDTRFMTSEEKAKAFACVESAQAKQDAESLEMINAPESDWMYRANGLIEDALTTTEDYVYDAEEINKDREIYAEWERDLLAVADSLPVVPSPVLCQDCLTNEATIFDLDAPSCDECERKYAAMNEPKKVATVNVVQARAGSNGMNHYHAPGCRDIAREAKRHGARKDMGVYEFPFTSVAAIIEHEYSDCNNGDWADMITHANDTFDGLVIMPCLRETLPLGMTPDGYMITQTPSGWGWKNAPLEKDMCTRCEVHGDISMPGKEIDGEWVCGFCLANPDLLTSTQKNESADTVATLVTREYHLRVLVDENTGATVDLGWVTLTVPSAFADSSDHVAAVYGAVHGEGNPRGGWGSIITVVESADL